MIADHPQDFANRVIELLENPRAAQRLCQNARSLVESRYDWNLVGAKFLKICGQLGDMRARTLEPIPQGAEA
jgi:glycosyltransferase involved in cell wall biosynthesis